MFPENYVDMEFPMVGDIVYVLLMRYPMPGSLTPFYVGQSSRHVGRMGDYVRANFTAATDFKVGEAVRFLARNHIDVLVRFWECADRKNEERRVIAQARSTYRLLNELSGYHRGTADVEIERLRVCQFMESAMAQAAAVAVPPTRAVCAAGNANANESVPRRVLAWLQANFPLNAEVNRSQILDWARANEINAGSILPADWCSNTVTGRWSRFCFLRSIGRGRYIFQGVAESDAAGGGLLPN